MRLIAVVGASGTQSVDVAGGAFPAMTIGEAETIENVRFITAASNFARISANTGTTTTLNASAISFAASTTSAGRGLRPQPGQQPGRRYHRAADL